MPPGPGHSHQHGPAPAGMEKKPTIEGIKNLVAVASGKGGVGKTTVAVNLALALKTMGAKVGLMDADVYGPNVPVMLGTDEQPRAVNEKTIIPVEAYGIKMISMGLLNPGDMFRQVNVEILGVVENMSYFNCPHCDGRIDVFGHGEGQHMAKNFGVPFLGEIEIDPQIRIGGDTGKPAASHGKDAPGAKSIFAVARNLVARLDEVNAASGAPVVEIL
jgi:Mrp family chromosome partitioning ATPase